MSEEPRRPRRPAFFSEADLEAHGGTVDPAREIEAAHETASVLVHAGRAAHDPALTARLVTLVEDLGLSTDSTAFPLEFSPLDILCDIGPGFAN